MLVLLIATSISLLQGLAFSQFELGNMLVHLSVVARSSWTAPVKKKKGVAGLHYAGGFGAYGWSSAQPYFAPGVPVPPY